MHAAPVRFTCCTYNLEWFFGAPPALITNLPPLAPLALKAARLAAHITTLPEAPHLIAVQEVEDDAAGRALVTALRAQSLDYHCVIGEHRSGRTGQHVGLLWRQPLELQWCKSFAVHSEADVAPFVRFRGDVAGLLDKNVYAHFDVHGHALLVVNVHLKAQYDEPCAAIRRLEAAVLQALVARERARNPALTTMLLGDFNDFDEALPRARSSLPLYSGVLRQIRTSADTLKDVIHYASAAEAAAEPVASTVYGDLIDHVLVDTERARITSCVVGVHPTDTADTVLLNRTSDHFPLMAWVELRN